MAEYPIDDRAVNVSISRLSHIQNSPYLRQTAKAEAFPHFEQGGTTNPARSKTATILDEKMTKERD